MKKSALFPVLLCGVVVAGVTACSPTLPDKHYWQRADTTSSIYTRGPKAQQMLHRDISRCVSEVRELERLGTIRFNIPAESGAVRGDARDKLAEWETPERDGYLRNEHMPFHDFESCMAYRGWERLEHVPYDVAERSRQVYIETITGERYQTKTRQRYVEPKRSGPFDGLND